MGLSIASLYLAEAPLLGYKGVFFGKICVLRRLRHSSLCTDADLGQMLSSTMYRNWFGPSLV